MKLSKKIFATALAMLMAVSVCLCTAGCDIEDVANMAEMLEQFSQFETNGGYTGDPVPDEEIYTLDIFDGLPETQSDIDPLFWVAEGKNGGKVYLLGSIHCAEPETYRLPDLLMDAYLESDALAVECDILAYENDYFAQIEMTQQMMYTDGSTIADHIDPDLYDALVDFYKSNPSDTLSDLGYTVEILDMCKPAMWMSALEMIIYEEAGIDSNLGIDYHFLNIATAQGKEIIELESVDFQNDMLFGFSNDLMEWQLWGYVSYSVDEQADSLREMFEGWCEGNPEYLVNAEPDWTGMTAEEIEYYDDLLTEYYTAMLIDRNIGMTDKAADMLDNGENVFYVVGAAHMVGNDGIIAMLKDRGYTVTQLGGMKADAYTDVNGNYPTLFPVDADEAATTTTTTTTTTTVADNTTEATVGTEYDYDLYVEMYEYFGGTTAPAATTTTAAVNNTQTTTTAADDNDNDNDGGYGGSGVFGN